MIRFVIERHEHDFNSGLERRDFKTLDVDLPELEEMLGRGGRGEMGFESWQLRGVEILHAHLAPIREQVTSNPSK